MKITKFHIAVCLFIAFGINGLAQEKVKGAKGEFRLGGSRQVTSPNTGARDYTEHGSLLAESLIWVSTKFIYSVAILSPWEKGTHQKYISPHPYDSNTSGHFQEEASKRHRIDLQTTMLIASGQLLGNHLQIKYRPWSILNLEASHSQMYEWGDEQQVESFRAYSLIANYERIRLDMFNFSWGVGAISIGSGVNKTGPTVKLNADAFIFKPFSLNISWQGSSISGMAMHHTRILAKYHYKNQWYSLGNENIYIGSTKFQFLSLGFGIFL